MLEHVLRSDESSPAHASLCFAVSSMGILPGRIGCHRINLFKVLQNDLKQRSISLNRYEDILYLRELAHNREQWRNMS